MNLKDMLLDTYSGLNLRNCNVIRKSLVLDRFVALRAMYSICNNSADVSIV